MSKKVKRSGVEPKEFLKKAFWAAEKINQAENHFFNVNTIQP